MTGGQNTYHTFSFADYRDPAHVHFRALRVINEDVIAAGRGLRDAFARDMEIITYVLEARSSIATAWAPGRHRPGRRAANERRHRRAAQRVQPFED